MNLIVYQNKNFAQIYKKKCNVQGSAKFFNNKTY
jgi:hypothetical protein